MAQFLSDEWIASFNAVLNDIEPPEGTTGTSMRVGSGTFSVEERVRAVPGRPESEGPLRVRLAVADGQITLSTGHDEDDPRPDVVVALAYEDAAALSRGELDATEALGSGRVHVRGDLSVLVAGQGILAAAARRMADLQAETTY